MIFCSWIYYFVSFLPRNFRLLCRQTWWWIIFKSRKRMVVSASKPAGKENQFIFVRPIEGDWLVVANKPFLEFQKLWLLNEANCKTFRVKTSFIYAWKWKLIFISVASHLGSIHKPRGWAMMILRGGGHSFSLLWFRGGCGKFPTKITSSIGGGGQHFFPEKEKEMKICYIASSKQIFI